MLKNALAMLDDYIQRLGLTVSQLERLHESDSQFGIMSAWKDYYGINENKQRTTKLVDELGLYGYTYQSARGIWVNNDVFDFEKSFLIYDIDFDTIYLLSDMFAQDAFIYKPSNGPVALYSLSSSVVAVMKSLDIRPNQDRMREKKRKMDEAYQRSQEEGDAMKKDLPPHTMLRDTELRYDFDFENTVPFTGAPVTYSEGVDDQG